MGERVRKMGIRLEAVSGDSSKKSRFRDSPLPRNRSLLSLPIRCGDGGRHATETPILRSHAGVITIAPFDVGDFSELGTIFRAASMILPGEWSATWRMLADLHMMS